MKAEAAVAYIVCSCGQIEGSLLIKSKFVPVGSIICIPTNKCAVFLTDLDLFRGFLFGVAASKLLIVQQFLT